VLFRSLEGELENELESEISFSSCLASEEGSVHDVSIAKNNIECSFSTCIAVESNAGDQGGSSITEKPKLVDDGTTPTNAQGYISSMSRGGLMMDLSPLFSPSPPQVNAVRKKNITSAAPEKLRDEEKCPPPPTLSVTNFQGSVWLDFGNEKKNVVGKTRFLHFLLSAMQEKAGANAIDADHYHVEVERMPTKKGISLYLYEEGLSSANISLAESITAIDVKRGDSQCCVVSWTPVEAGGVRETIHLKMPRGRLQITVHGYARYLRPKKSTSPKKKSPVSTKTTTKPVSNDESELRCRTPALPPKVHYLTPHNKKLPSSVLPVHSVTSPLKETPKLVCDAGWAETQCDAFAKWMNYTLKPTEQNSHENDFQKSDRVALRTLLLHRRQAQARRKAQELYNSVEMRSIRVAVTSAVEKGHLAIREDRDLHADLGSRDTALELLLCYATPWLQLGLETVFGEVIDFDEYRSLSRLTANPTNEKLEESNVKLLAFRRKAMLKQFILERVLSDPAIRTKYTAGRCKVPSGVFGKRYAAELRVHSLLQVLLLVAFLDLCKRENILESVPRLFTKAGSVKSSCALLVSFCREFMFGEANIIKHLSRLGINVTYEQKLIDEIDFDVVHLASDIRDGVRLVRLVEILQGNNARSLTEKLRLPAVSRLQKLHNVDIALRALSETSSMKVGNIRAKHIVDAHRDKVLLLLWSIVAHFKLSDLLDPDLLRREIRSVWRAGRKRDSKTAKELSNFLASLDLMEKKQSNDLVSLLLQWCQMVCLQFGVHVQNFSTSFADGKVLCCLIHHYHPDILFLGDIRPTSRDLQLKVDPCSLSESSRMQFKHVLENERYNSTLANLCIEELGGIPPMLPVMDSCNVPEEKCVITALSYIFCRLIETSKEVRSAKIIQEAFRRPYDEVRCSKEKWAASRILRFWSRHKVEYFLSMKKKYGNSVEVIEQFFLAHRQKVRSKRESKTRDSAATLIQGAARCKLARSYFLVLQFCAAEIQRIWRSYNAQIFFHSSLYWCIILQRSCRTYIHRRKLSKFRSQVTALQCYCRMKRAKCHLAEKRERLSMREVLSACLIQKTLRCFLFRTLYAYHMKASMFIQAQVRRLIALQAYSTRRHCVVKLQSEARGFLVRVTMYLAHVSSCDIQRVWRGYHVRYDLCRFFSGIILFQSLLRRRHATSQILFLKQLHSTKIRRLESFATIAQRMWRGSAARSNYMNFVVGSIIVQSAFRRLLAMQDYSTLQRGVVQAQAGIRGLLVRNTIYLEYLSSCHIQSLWRGFCIRLAHKTFSSSIISFQTAFRRRQAQFTYQEYIVVVKRQLEADNRKLESCVLEIQRAWRGSVARDKYTLIIVGSIIVQSTIRGLLTAKAYSRMRRGIMRLQAATRGLLVRNANDLANLFSCIIQRLWRGYQVRLGSKKLFSSIILLQASSRKRQAVKFMGFVKQLLEAEALNQESSARSIQRMWRGSSTRSQHVIYLVSSIVIQTSFRRAILVYLYKAVVSNICCIQRLVRGHVVRRRRIQADCAALDLQRIWRGHKCRAKLKVQYLAASHVQRMWRGARSQVHYIIILLSVITLQSWFRSAWHQKRYDREKKCALKLQHLTRRFLMYRLHSKQDAASRCIQLFWRTQMHRLLQGRAFVAARKIQCWLKVQRAIAKQVKCKSACISVQRAVRIMIRRFYLKRKTASCQIQRMWRGYQIQVDYMIMILAAIAIQSTIRAATDRKRHHLQLSSAIEVQSLVRTFISRSRFKTQFLQTSLKKMIRESAASKIQEVLCFALFQKKIGHNARRLQTLSRMFLARTRFQKARKVAFFLQVMFHGNKVRTKSSKHVKVLTKKIRLATQKALREPQMQLGRRTTRALYILQTSKRMVELMEAIETLEISTRLSKSCCIAFADTGAPTILYDLIRTCNRSLPHIELLQLVLATLENVSVYPTLRSSIATNDSVDTLIDLIQMFRDKEVVLWFSAYLLLIILRHNDKFLINFCASSENMRRLKGVYSISQKKAALGVNSSTSNRHLAKKARRFNSINMNSGIQLLGRVISTCKDFV